ncbi:MAG: hypothetical protein IT379_29795 [Deltaproteobacteria bacterium]|nr:hypothetical protein [Deltaproteobacteria bacterium]
MPPPAPEPKVDVRTLIGNYLSYVRRGLRYWYVIPAVFVVVASAAAYYALSRPLVYRSTATVNFRYSRAMFQGEDNPMQGMELRDVLVGVFRSRTFHESIVDENNLYDWMKPPKFTRDDRIAEMMSATNWEITSPDTFTVTWDGESPALSQQILQKVLDKFVATRQSRRAVEAQGALRAVEREREHVYAVMDGAEDRYERFVGFNRAGVQALESRRRGMGLPGESPAAAAARIASQNASASTTVTEPARPNEPYRVRQARRRVRDLEQRIAQLSAPQQQAAPRPQAQETEASRAIREQLDEQRGRLRSLLGQYTEEHPDVRSARRRVQELEAQYRAAQRPTTPTPVASGMSPAERAAQLRVAQDELDRARSALNAAIREERNNPSEPEGPDGGARVARPVPTPAGGVAVDDVDGGAAAATRPPPVLARSPDEDMVRRFDDTVELENAYDRLRAAIDTQRDRLQHLGTRELELRATVQAESDQQRELITVLDPPNRPGRHFWPNRPKILGAGAAAGFAIGLMGALLLGLLDSRLYDSGDLRRWGDLPELPAVPDLTPLMKSAPRDVVTGPAPAAKARTG